jgi:hypothetical protein
MRTFTITTTWGEAHWNVYAKRCVESIAEFWPHDVKKIYYPDNNSQRIDADNTFYYDLKTNQSELQEFIDRNNNNDLIKERMNKPMRSAFEYDAVRFSYKVFCMLDAAEKCQTDVLIFIDADTVTYKPIPMEWLEHIAPYNKFTTFLGRPKKGFSETGFITFNLKMPESKKFFARWKEYYTKDLWQNLQGFTDSYTYDAARIDTTNRSLDNDLNDGRYLGLRGSKHPFVNSELGDYMDHLKGERKDIQSSVEDMKVKRQDTHWQ